MVTQQELEQFEAFIRFVRSGAGAAGRAVTSRVLEPYLNRYMSLQRISRGTRIIRAGESLTRVIFVVSGEFYLTRETAQGGVSMVARVWAPEFLGIPQLVTPDSRYYSSIYASEPCQMVFIDCDFFEACLHRSPEVAMCCVDCMSRSLQRNYRQMERIAMFDTSENLLGYIYRKWVEAGACRQPLCIREKHTVIARELGVTVRTVCRLLNRMKELELLSTNPKGHILVTPEQMECIQQSYRPEESRGLH